MWTRFKNIYFIPVVFLASYVAYNLVLAVLTVIVSVVVVSFHNRDAKRTAVPRLMRSVSYQLVIVLPRR